MILIDGHNRDLRLLSKQRPGISQKFWGLILFCYGLPHVLLLRRHRPEFSCEKLLRFSESFHHQSLRARPWSGFHCTLLLPSNREGLPQPICCDRSWGGREGWEAEGKGQEWEGALNAVWEQGCAPPKVGLESHPGNSPDNSASHSLPVAPSFEKWYPIFVVRGSQTKHFGAEHQKSGFTIHWLSFAKLWNSINHSIMEKNNFSLASAQRISTDSLRIKSW